MFFRMKRLQQILMPLPNADKMDALRQSFVTYDPDSSKLALFTDQAVKPNLYNLMS